MGLYGDVLTFGATLWWQFGELHYFSTSVSASILSSGTRCLVSVWSLQRCINNHIYVCLHACVCAVCFSSSHFLMFLTKREHSKVQPPCVDIYKVIQRQRCDCVCVFVWESDKILSMLTLGVLKCAFITIIITIIVIIQGHFSYPAWTYRLCCFIL